MNEPVAWLIQAKIWHEFTFSKPAEDSEDVVITPLYTHPSEHDLGVAEAIGFDKGYKAAKAQEPDCYGDGNVYRGVRSKDSEVKTYVFDEHAGKQTWSNPAKTLTDEEILEIAQIMFVDTRYPQHTIGFARAILRKAQEK